MVKKMKKQGKTDAKLGKKEARKTFSPPKIGLNQFDISFTMSHFYPLVYILWTIDNCSLP